MEAYFLVGTSKPASQELRIIFLLSDILLKINKLCIDKQIPC